MDQQILLADDSIPVLQGSHAKMHSGRQAGSLASGEGQDGANGSWLHHRTEHVGEVDTGTLGKATNDPACFIALEGPVGAVLVPEDPFASNGMSVRWFGNKAPGFVSNKSIKFFLHGGTPVGVTKSSGNRCWHRGYGGRRSCDGRGGVPRIRFDDPGASASLHVVASRRRRLR